MTDDQGNDLEPEPAPDDPRINMLTRASSSIHVAPLDAARVVRAARARRRRNRTIISSVLAFAVIVAGVSVAIAGSSQNQNDNIDAADPPQTAAPTVGCSGMAVVSAQIEDGNLLLSLRNGGTSNCDVRGLGLASSDVMGDKATANDFERGDSLADGPLAPGNAVLVTAATDTCQAAGLPMSVSFTDASTLEFTFPGGRRACDQPAFGIDITAMRTVPVEQEQPAGTQPLRVTLGPLDAAELPLTAGSARFDAVERTLIYRPQPTVFGSACEPVTSASETQAASVLLSFEVVPNRDVDCPSEFLAAVATISGLTEVPAEFLVTENGETSTVPVTPAPGVVLLSASAPSNATRTARISGPLNLQGDCVSVGTSVALWPYGTTVISESPLQIRVPGAGVFTEGEAVTGPGGFFDAETDDVPIQIPDSCGTTRGTTINPQLN